jgi:hypothetical protein
MQRAQRHGRGVAGSGVDQRGLALTRAAIKPHAVSKARGPAR